MVLSLWPLVVSGVKVEEKELLSEGDRSKKLCHAISCFRTNTWAFRAYSVLPYRSTVEKNGQKSVGEEGEGD